MHVASLGTKIYVLHCFEKKSQETPKKDVELAKRRYQELTQQLQDEQRKLKKERKHGN